MTDIIFEWDARKAQQNETKHGISFEAAPTAFYNENAQLGENHCAPITASNAWS
ncbi:MAG: BrnT family toxin [Cyanobacteria bacterium P01_H01_bin.152]